MSQEFQYIYTPPKESKFEGLLDVIVSGVAGGYLLYVLLKDDYTFWKGVGILVSFTALFIWFCSALITYICRVGLISKFLRRRIFFGSHVLYRRYVLKPLLGLLSLSWTIIKWGLILAIPIAIIALLVNAVSATAVIIILLILILFKKNSNSKRC
jgi:hypothetical protein